MPYTTDMKFKSDTYTRCLVQWLALNGNYNYYYYVRVPVTINTFHMFVLKKCEQLPKIKV